MGNGFPVKSLLSPGRTGEAISPFLLLDHAGPFDFQPTEQPRGVEEHPHRGFETVTIVFDGALRHRDSSGASGSIGPGDVQWMTAASGVVHEEMHDPAFSRQGGRFEVAQLWVNLPAKNKMDTPSYQAITADQVAEVAVPGGQVRVVAGELLGVRGPARTHTPMTVGVLTLEPGAKVELQLPATHNAALVVFSGSARVGEETARTEEVVLFAKDGEGITVEALEPLRALVLTGEPIEEPIAAHGPFVMNTFDEIRQAIDDYQNGRMGHLEPVGR